MDLYAILVLSSTIRIRLNGLVKKCHIIYIDSLPNHNRLSEHKGL